MMITSNERSEHKQRSVYTALAQHPASLRVKMAGNLFDCGCDRRASTGGNGNPGAPPALVTTIQQPVSSAGGQHRRRAGA